MVDKSEKFVLDSLIDSLNAMVKTCDDQMRHHEAVNQSYRLALNPWFPKPNEDQEIDTSLKQIPLKDDPPKPQVNPEIEKAETLLAKAQLLRQRQLEKTESQKSSFNDLHSKPKRTNQKSISSSDNDSQAIIKVKSDIPKTVDNSKTRNASTNLKKDNAAIKCTTSDTRRPSSNTSVGRQRLSSAKRAHVHMRAPFHTDAQPSARKVINRPSSASRKGSASTSKNVPKTQTNSAITGKPKTQTNSAVTGKPKTPANSLVTAKPRPQANSGVTGIKPKASSVQISKSSNDGTNSSSCLTYLTSIKPTEVPKTEESVVGDPDDDVFQPSVNLVNATIQACDIKADTEPDNCIRNTEPATIESQAAKPQPFTLKHSGRNISLPIRLRKAYACNRKLRKKAEMLLGNSAVNEKTNARHEFINKLESHISTREEHQISLFHEASVLSSAYSHLRQMLQSIVDDMPSGQSSWNEVLFNKRKIEFILQSYASLEHQYNCLLQSLNKGEIQINDLSATLLSIRNKFCGERTSSPHQYVWLTDSFLSDIHQDPGHREHNFSSMKYQRKQQMESIISLKHQIQLLQFKDRLMEHFSSAAFPLINSSTKRFDKMYGDVSSLLLHDGCSAPILLCDNVGE